MPFQLKRPNASIWDLPQEKQAEFRTVTDLYDMTGKHRSPMANAALIQLFEYFGQEKTCEMIERWAMLGYHSLDSLVKLCNGEIPSERTVAKKQAVNELPGRERKYEAGPKEPQKKRLPTGWMTRDNAIAWMRDNHPADMDLFDEYFQDLGWTVEFGQVFILKTRASQ